MNKIKIVADSTCDLSPELVKRYDVEIVPLFVALDDKIYRDGKEITPDEVYALGRMSIRRCRKPLQFLRRMFTRYLKIYKRRL